MEPGMAMLILKAGRLSLEAARKGEVIERLSSIQSSLDQLISREMGSAYDALSDALQSSNEQTKNIRLNFAEARRRGHTYTLDNVKSVGVTPVP